MKIRYALVGSKIWKYHDIVAAFAGDKRFRPSRSGGYRVMVGLSNTGIGKHEFSRYDPLLVGLDVNPFCINAWNGHAGGFLFSVCLGSFCPSVRTKFPEWQPGRWERIADRYGLPTCEEWRPRCASGKVVVLAAKRGGWRYKDEQYWEHYARVLSDVRRATANEVVVRLHPFNRGDGRTSETMNEMCEKHGGMRVDDRAEMSDDLFDDTLACVSSWGSASARFVMHGIPVVNAADVKSENVCAEIDAGFEYLRAESGDHVCATSPRRYLNDLSQSVFSAADFRSGTATRVLAGFLSQ